MVSVSVSKLVDSNSSTFLTHSLKMSSRRARIHHCKGTEPLYLTLLVDQAEQQERKPVLSQSMPHQHNDSCLKFPSTFFCVSQQLPVMVQSSLPMDHEMIGPSALTCTIIVHGKPYLQCRRCGHWLGLESIHSHRSLSVQVVVSVSVSKLVDSNSSTFLTHSLKMSSRRARIHHCKRTEPLYLTLLVDQAEQQERKPVFSQSMPHQHNDSCLKFPSTFFCVSQQLPVMVQSSLPMDHEMIGPSALTCTIIVHGKPYLQCRRCGHWLGLESIHSHR